MKRVLGSLAVIAGLCSGPSVTAEVSDPGLAAMTERLSRSEVLRADFRQEKTLQVLSRPLVSQGKLVFAAGEGVLWHVLAPYEVFVLLKPDEVVEWSTEGEKRRLDTGSNPVFRALTDVIMATLSGDSQSLQRHFDLSPIPSETGWRLSLRPKSKDLGAVVADIQVFGDRFVEGVQVTEAKGDTTAIQFSGFSAEPAVLDEIEQDYFAQ